MLIQNPGFNDWLKAIGLPDEDDHELILKHLVGPLESIRRRFEQTPTPEYTKGLPCTEIPIELRMTLGLLRLSDLHAYWTSDSRAIVNSADLLKKLL